MRDRELEAAKAQINALEVDMHDYTSNGIACHCNGGYHCIDCVEMFLLEDDPVKVAVFHGALKQWDSNNVQRQEEGLSTLASLGICGILHEDTVQYEQYPGELIPLKGIYCVHCDAELYAPYEIEVD